MKKGFTLVEVMAIIVILGIIALVTVPSVNYIMTSSKKDTLQISLESLLKVVKNDYEGNVRYGMVVYTLSDNTLICTSGCNEGKITIKYSGDLSDASGSITMNDKDIDMNIDSGKYTAFYKQGKCVSKDFRKKGEACTVVSAENENEKCGTDGNLCTFVEKVVVNEKSN